MGTWIGFRGVKAKQFLTRTGLCMEQPILKVEQDDKLIRSMDSIVSASKMTSNKDLLLTAKLYEFLYLLVELYPNRKSIAK
ncbi:hypothetical protein [Bacillus changyiensis]|uniref:hypothetical protein n=1 Tax=Bacillus changyiensis TaxID=3004103 RepID=UPI0022E6CF2C|nr:hypothetical protein [Bacillus changyiensis]MDA1477442.1 hypothetical protein [Bacillus changyiensis]